MPRAVKKPDEENEIMEWLSRKIRVIYRAYTRDGIEESGKTHEKRGEDWTLTVPSLFFIRPRRRRSDFVPLFSFCALFMNPRDVRRD